MAKTLTFEDANPLRTFVIFRGLAEPEVVVPAHYHRTEDNGTLHLFQLLADGSAWTIRVFAAGTWTDLLVEVPTQEQVNKMNEWAVLQRTEEQKEQIVGSLGPFRKGN